MLRTLFAAAAAVFALAAPEAHADTAPDYAARANWLCLPGRADACRIDQTASVVNADGSVRTERFRSARRPKIDCFYVYPTVSLDPGANSDMLPNDEERFVVAQQLARFASQCRLFAPMYRQVTLTALRAGFGGQPMQPDRMMAFNDVKAAWEHYLAHHNNGRGVVLIGHSQGAGILSGLIATEIDGKPVWSKLVSALLIGANVPVPYGDKTGGMFSTVRLCESADQWGCVVSYVSFRDTVPPPANARFGAIGASFPFPLPEGRRYIAACVNPAALLRGTPRATLQPYFGTNNRQLDMLPATQFAWLPGRRLSTPYVTLPGLLSAECVTTPTHAYLSVHVNADPADPRTDDIPGDIRANGRLLDDWGMHMVDMNLTMGDLVELVGRQGRAYAARPR